MGLLKIFKSSKSNANNETGNRSHSFSSANDNDSVPLPPPPRMARDQRLTSTSSVRSGSSFMGRRIASDRSRSKDEIKTIPYDSTPMQQPPQYRTASSSDQSYARISHYGAQNQPSRMSSAQPQYSSTQPSPQRPSLRQAPPTSAERQRPLSKYVLPVLNLDHERPRTEERRAYSAGGAQTIPSSRDMEPSKRIGNDSDRSWTPPPENNGRGQYQPYLPSSRDHRSVEPVENGHHRSVQSHEQRPLPEPPGGGSRPGSVFGMGVTSRTDTSSFRHQSSASVTALSKGTTQRPSHSINPVPTGSSAMSTEDLRTDSHLSIPGNDKATASNQSVFPWLNRSRSKSPNTLGLGRPLEQGSAAMTKTKSKEKAKGKPKPGEEDGSFKVKAFRHVSSGSGVPPWEVQFDYEGGQQLEAATSTRSESDPVVPQRADLRDISTSQSSHPDDVSGRRSMSYVGRPPSIAGSINNDDTPRQVSVQRFKQTRRYSGISMNGDNGFASHEQLPYRSSGQGHTRIKSDSSGVEILVSPQKRRMANQDSDNSDEEVLATNHWNGKDDSEQYPASRPMNRSYSTSALSIESPIERPAFTAGGVHPAVRRSLDQGRELQTPGIVSLVPHRSSGFAVQNRRAVSVFDESTRISVNNGRQIEPQPKTRPFGHDRSQSASGIQDLAAAISHPSQLSSGVATSDSRPSLRERLAGLALSTPPVTDLPLVSSPDCEIPPAPSDSPEPPIVQAVIARPASAQGLATARPSAQQRSASAISTNRQKVRTGWDASSSDEESDSAKKRIRKPRTASAANAPLPAFKVQSLPSGVRRPPAPSEAFGPDEHDSPKPSGASGNQGSRTSSFNSTKSPLPSSFERARTSRHQRTPSSAMRESGSDSSSSSDDEPLTAIKHRQSSNSLNSGASFVAPSNRAKTSSRTSSPAKSVRSSSNLSLPPANSSQSVSRSATSTSSLNTTSTAMSPVQRSSQLLSNSVVPRPPSTWTTAGLHTRESPTSSQSGATTGDTSSGGVPATPQEQSIALGNPVVVRSTRSSFSSTQLANTRRVSFAEHGDGQSVRNVEEDAEKEQVRKTNERRREEARKATEIGQAANGTPDEDAAPPQNPTQYLQNMQSQIPQFGQMSNSFNPYFGMAQPGYMDPTQQMYMLQMQMAQMAQMNPAMVQMQQQAMALAKQQYQAAMVAAAMQAAEDAWERGSNMTGLGSTSGRTTSPMAQMPYNNNNFGMGGPGMFGMLPTFDGAGSTHGAISPTSGPSPQYNTFAAPRPAASVYGESSRPRMIPGDQPRPNRSRSSPSLDKLMAEQANDPSTRRRPESQAPLNQQKPLPSTTTRRPQPKSMIPMKGPDNEILQINTQQHTFAAPSGVAVPPSTWRTRSSGDRIR
ncbi:hypothetical protein QFC22_002345 [Naganishia vaughanmartiniae]|uniref:Uncharacterized protein n=1 Tax=Naganishia vaughanmartiniae TaxID=1424756 RepID=A0ACC2XEB6_9TREE|nr:hypothetical protein QFC22_002345 [Naganishia vaughanmartiniae]